MKLRPTSILAIAALAATGGLVAQEQGGEVPALPLEESAKPKNANTAEQRLLAIGEALAAANAELQALREQHAQLQLQMEALGVPAALKGDERSLQGRIIKAASELRISEKAREEAVERANRLAEAAAAFMARPSEPALKTALDEAIKAVTSAKTPATGAAVSLDAARIVSYKAELGLAVINAGKESGVRMGAPLHVIRDDKSIASGLVVDVRDRVAGLLLTGPVTAAVRVGDGVKPELTQNSPK